MLLPTDMLAPSTSTHSLLLTPMVLLFQLMSLLLLLPVLSTSSPKELSMLLRPQLLLPLLLLPMLLPQLLPMLLLPLLPTPLPPMLASLGDEVLSTGSSNSRLINRDNSTIGVSTQLGVQVEGSSISIVRSICSWSSSIGNSWGNSNNWGLGSIDSSLGGEMLSTGSSNSRLINRGNSTIGVSNQGRDSSKGASISIGGSVGSRNSSIAEGGSSS